MGSIGPCSIFLSLAKYFSINISNYFIWAIHVVIVIDLKSIREWETVWSNGYVV